MRRRPCRRPVISLCNIVLHLLVRHTALLRRLSQNLAHTAHFCFSHRFLEVPLNYTMFHAELIETFFRFFGRLCKGYRNISFRFFAFTFAFDPL